jgi:hypothetical protein
MANYHAVYIDSPASWTYNTDSYDAKLGFYSNAWLTNETEETSETPVISCSYFYELGKQDEVGFTPRRISMSESSGILTVEGKQENVSSLVSKSFRLNSPSPRFLNLRESMRKRRPARFIVNNIITDDDAELNNIKDYLGLNEEEAEAISRSEEFGAEAYEGFEQGNHHIEDKYFYELTEREDEYWSGGQNKLNPVWGNESFINALITENQNEENYSPKMIVDFLLETLKQKEKELNIIQRRYKDENIKTFLRRNPFTSRRVMNPDYDDNNDSMIGMTPSEGWGSAWINIAIKSLNQEIDDVYERDMNRYGDMPDGAWDYVGELQEIRKQLRRDRNLVFGVPYDSESFEAENWSFSKEYDNYYTQMNARTGTGFYGDVIVSAYGYDEEEGREIEKEVVGLSIFLRKKISEWMQDRTNRASNLKWSGRKGNRTISKISQGAETFEAENDVKEYHMVLNYGGLKPQKTVVEWYDDEFSMGEIIEEFRELALNSDLDSNQLQDVFLIDADNDEVKYAYSYVFNQFYKDGVDEVNAEEFGADTADVDFDEAYMERQDAERIMKLLRIVKRKATGSNARYAKTYAREAENAYYQYGMRGLTTQVAYVLSNLSGWRGEEAKSVKAELRKLIK